MAYEHKDMSGTIFKNRHKSEGDKRPDYRGEIMVRGELLEIALWIKDGAKGKFFSAKVQERREQQTIPAAKTDGQSIQPRTARRASAEMDEDVPF